MREGYIGRGDIFVKMLHGDELQYMDVWLYVEGGVLVEALQGGEMHGFMVVVSCVEIG